MEHVLGGATGGWALQRTFSDCQGWSPSGSLVYARANGEMGWDAGAGTAVTLRRGPLDVSLCGESALVNRWSRSNLCALASANHMPLPSQTSGGARDSRRRRWKRCWARCTAAGWSPTPRCGWRCTEHGCGWETRAGPCQRWRRLVRYASVRAQRLASGFAVRGTVSVTPSCVSTDHAQRRAPRCRGLPVEGTLGGAASLAAATNTFALAPTDIGHVAVDGGGGN